MDKEKYKNAIIDMKDGYDFNDLKSRLLKFKSIQDRVSKLNFNPLAFGGSDTSYYSDSIKDLKRMLLKIVDDYSIKSEIITRSLGIPEYIVSILPFLKK